MKTKINDLLNDFRSLDFSTKILIFVSSLFFTFLFCENFLFSSSFSILSLREIDDVAFQYSIRNIHESISSFRFERLLKLNDYGYGWIFWIIVGIATYPLYLVAQFTDFYVPLIVFPRQISLAFTIGTAFLVYKILSIYTKNERLKLLAILLLFSFPAFGFFAMRFGTVAQVTFFAALTFYLAARNDYYEKKDLKQIAIAAAACVGTKINGALILPLVGMILIDRMSWSISKENLKKAGYFLKMFVPFFALFSYPALYLAPFRPVYFAHYFNALKNNSHLANMGNFWINLQEVFSIGYLNIFCASVLIVLLFFGFFLHKEKRRDFIFVALWIVFVTCFLTKIMSMGTSYVVNYALVIMYLLVLAIVAIESWKRCAEILAVVILVVSIVVNFTEISSGYYTNMKYSNLQKNPEIIQKIAAIEEIKKLIPDPKESDQQVVLLTDYRSVFPYTSFDRKNIRAIFSFDNFNLNLIEGGFDYISLYKGSPYFSDEKIANLVKKMNNKSEIENLLASKDLIAKLLASNKLGDFEYEEIFDGPNIKIFRKKL